MAEHLPGEGNPGLRLPVRRERRRFSDSPRGWLLPLAPGPYRGIIVRKPPSHRHLSAPHRFPPPRPPPGCEVHPLRGETDTPAGEHASHRLRPFHQKPFRQPPAGAGGSAVLCPVAHNDRQRSLSASGCFPRIPWGSESSLVMPSLSVMTVLPSPVALRIPLTFPPHSRDTLWRPEPGLTAGIPGEKPSFAAPGFFRETTPWSGNGSGGMRQSGWEDHWRIIWGEGAGRDSSVPAYPPACCGGPHCPAVGGRRSATESPSCRPVRRTNAFRRRRKFPARRRKKGPRQADNGLGFPHFPQLCCANFPYAIHSEKTQQ